MKQFNTKREMCNYIMRKYLEVYDSKGCRYYIRNYRTGEKQVFTLPNTQEYEELAL